MPSPSSQPPEPPYHRPNQAWICGRSDCGEACLNGPDHRGRCRTGDPANPGRPACRPRRSLRSWRGLLSLACLAATAGLLLLVFGSRRGNQFLSPGELTSAHAASQPRCADCHAGISDGPPAAWLAGAITAASPERQSGLCLECHAVGTEPMLAHGLPAGELSRLTARMAAAPAGQGPAHGTVPANAPAAEGRALACATCHQEHHGLRHDLTRISNQQCQNCHAVTFASFADGHPPFRDYPAARRTRIIFDHQTHLERHFREPAQAGVAPRSCADCHQADARGETMAVRPFEQSCASCHQHTAQIRGVGRADAPGVAFFRVPGLDVESLRDRGFEIGAWPEFAEGRLTPFMELLFADDPATRAALEAVATADLLDLADADEARLKAAHQIAWAVKGLMFDLLREGQPHLLKRWADVGLTNLPAGQLEHLAGALSPDLLHAAAAAWFPGLADEVEKFRTAGKLEQPPAAAPESPAPASGVKPEAWTVTGGWYRSDLDYTLYYRVSRHADPFLTAWLEAAWVKPPAVVGESLKRVFAELGNPKAPGYCLKCHSADLVPEPAINWLAARPDPEMHRFTRFSHSAHFSLLNDDGCYRCHPLAQSDKEAGYAAAFAAGQGDPAVFRSNFRTVERAMCAECHVPDGAGDHCLLCHSYHVGKFVSTLPGERAGRQQFPASDAPAKPRP